MTIRLRRTTPLKDPLTGEGPEGTLAGGKAGQDQEEAYASSAMPPSLTVAVVMDTCLGALVGMMACVLRPDSRGARERLDRNYETLIECLEEWRDAVPKA